MYETSVGNILVDIGITSKKLLLKLNEINIDPRTIDVIFITHEHVDHIKGLKVFLKKYQPKVITRKQTYNTFGFEIENIEFVLNEYDFNGLDIKLLNTSHDAKSSFGLIFNPRLKKFVHITDSGYLKQDLIKLIANASGYLIESNYDYEKLISNDNYPFMTKKRIMSDLGHLSNEQCNEYLKQVISSETKVIMYAHLSPNNNEVDLVLKQNQDIDVKKIVLSKEDTVTVILGE